jgi:putative tricarboxylic transport membrane protein
MLAGIYYGAQYGGSTTAILVNLPGESSSVVTAIDGYQMARQGRAGPALADRRDRLVLRRLRGHADRRFGPPLTELAFKFGPAEYFSLMVLGLIGAVVLAKGSLLKAIAMIVLGLLLGLVGTDVEPALRAWLRHPRAVRRHRLRRRSRWACSASPRSSRNLDEERARSSPQGDRA